MNDALQGSKVLAQAVQRLIKADVPDAARDARRILSHVMQIEAGRLTLILPEPMLPEVVERFEALIERRCKREPVSHLTGQRGFFGRNFKVTPEVLDPRPETEMLIEAALSLPFENLLDLGTGSGCILLTLLAETKATRGIGIDLDPAALLVAQHNAESLGLKARTQFIKSDWFDDVSGVFDLIVANPPYIASHEMAELSPEVRDYEPRIALTDEADGLEAYRMIFCQVQPFLAPDGRVIVEIGPDQAEDVCQIVVEAGFSPIAIVPDLDGRDRVVVSMRLEMPF